MVHVFGPGRSWDCLQGPEEKTGKLCLSAWVRVSYLYGGQLVAGGVWQAAVGVSVAETGADHPQLVEGVEEAGGASRGAGDRPQLGEVHTQVGET